MKKSEIFSQVLYEIAKTTEIDPADILSRSRREELVDARLMLVRCCSEMGLRPMQIAGLLGQTPHNIYRSLRSAIDRYRYSVRFRADYDSICKELGISM